jgi:hypothetical protein
MKNEKVPVSTSSPAEFTSPKTLRISGRVSKALARFDPASKLSELPQRVLDKITVGDVVSIAQSCNTQARPKAK